MEKNQARKEDILRESCKKGGCERDKQGREVKKEEGRSDSGT